jgi:hypothetical protein
MQYKPLLPKKQMAMEDILYELLMKKNKDESLDILSSFGFSIKGAVTKEKLAITSSRRSGLIDQQELLEGLSP